MAWKLVRSRLPRRRWIALLVALAVVGLFLFTRQQTRFGERQFEQLREGMTEAEVVAVLGSPAGDYQPAIWSPPDWYVSTSDAIGFLRKERGRSLQELEQLKQQDAEEWVQAGKPIPPPTAGPIFRTPVSKARPGVFGFDRQPSGNGANTWASRCAGVGKPNWLNTRACSAVSRVACTTRPRRVRRSISP
jgi:hypothetical protein